jgi:hypothetical protein
LLGAPTYAADKPGPSPVPREVVNDQGQKSDIQKNASENKNKDGPTFKRIKDSQEKSAEPTKQDERPSQRVVISPIDINSIKLGPLDVGKDWVDYAFAFFSLCLVSIGILQWRVYREQAKHMREGLKQTEIAANAAIENAKTASRQTALIFNHERPWIAVKPQKPPNWPLPPDAKFEFPLLIEVPWTAKNVGKTPAFIRDINVITEVMPIPLPENRPADPVPNRLPQFIIPPNDDHSGAERVLIWPEEYRGIKESRYGIVFYGFIKYDDTLENREHISRFCSYWFYLQGIELFEPIGPSDWIEYI